jgi:hypothetical protein
MLVTTGGMCPTSCSGPLRAISSPVIPASAQEISNPLPSDRVLSLGRRSFDCDRRLTRFSISPGHRGREYRGAKLGDVAVEHP